MDVDNLSYSSIILRFFSNLTLNFRGTPVYRGTSVQNRCAGLYMFTKLPTRHTLRI
jgi:hypothetical protein